MRCDTCKREADVVMRVVVAKGYNRSLARPLFNCPECFEKKERASLDCARDARPEPAEGRAKPYAGQTGAPTEVGA